MADSATLFLNFLNFAKSLNRETIQRKLISECLFHVFLCDLFKTGVTFQFQHEEIPIKTKVAESATIIAMGGCPVIELKTRLYRPDALQ